MNFLSAETGTQEPSRGIKIRIFISCTLFVLRSVEEAVDSRRVETLGGFTIVTEKGGFG